MKVKRALISVSDKTGLENLVKGLDEMDVEIVSTGGTAKAISSYGVNVVEVSSYTGFPEMLEGRVKTLNPKIHAGLLAIRGNKEHAKQMEEYDIPYIDMVVVNLYPFEETILKPNVTEEEAIENIDIGGPSMLRSAAKNFKSVAAISSSGQYDKVLMELKENDGELSEETLRALAADVFTKTSSYDKAITDYLFLKESEEGDNLPNQVDLKLEKVMQLRYGENPHQKAAFYKDTLSQELGLAHTKQLQGKQLSFNNILDLNVAMEMVKEFSEPAVSIIKHNNPCGAASAETTEKAFMDALDSDRLSAFGSIIGFNSAIDEALAKTILNEADFVECIIAPRFSDKALKVFSSKKNLRLIETPEAKHKTSKSFDIKKLTGGALIQEVDSKIITEDDLKVVTKTKPKDEVINSMLFGWKVIKYVKSNAILLCQGTKTVGIGAGQTSRVDSVIIAVRKAAEKAKGSVLVSDAFFPKSDSIDQAHKAGISAIIQPGGSIRDKEVIDACDKFGIPMVFTGIRHFRH